MDVHFINGGVKPVTGQQLIKSLGIAELEEEDARLLESIASEAEKIACPKAVFMRAEIEEMGEDYVCAGGQRFNSALVRKNVSRAEFIIPYTATCGRELYEWSAVYQDDVLAMIACDALMEAYLRRMCMLMAKTAKEIYYGGADISSMAPGSVDAMWPITEQKKLFEILGENARKAGVSLTESCLMIPAKSVSGFYFSAEEHFENCMLCTRENCPNRRAKFKGEL